MLQFIMTTYCHHHNHDHQSTEEQVQNMRSRCDQWAIGCKWTAPRLVRHKNFFASRKYKDVKIEKCRNILRLLEIAFHRFFCTTICICGAGMYLMGDLGSWKDQAVCYPLVVRSQDRAEREWGGGNSIQTENTVSLFFSLLNRLRLYLCVFGKFIFFRQ